MAFVGYSSGTEKFFYVQPLVTIGNKRKGRGGKKTTQKIHKTHSKKNTRRNGKRTNKINQKTKRRNKIKKNKNKTMK